MVSSGTINLSISNVDIWTEYHDEIQKELNKRGDLFKPQGEFETSSNYASRLKEAKAYREKVFLDFQKKHQELLAQKIKHSYRKVSLNIQSLGRYNADKQYFPVTINHITRNIKIPLQDAPDFKRYIDTMQVVAEEQLNEDGRSMRMFNIKIFNPLNGSQYLFSSHLEQPLFLVDNMTQTLSGIPKLKITNIDLSEPSGDGYLNAEEKGLLMLTIKNVGNGTAEDVNINVYCNRNEHLSYTPNIQIASIKPGETAQEAVQLFADRGITTDTCELTLSFSEAHGFNPNPIKYPVETKAFLPPNLVYTQPQIKELDPQKHDGKIEKLEKIEVDIQIRNIGTGTAKNAWARINISGLGIYTLTSTRSEEYRLGDLKPGDSAPVHFSFIVTNQYTGGNLLPIGLSINEGNDANTSKNYSLNLELDKGAPVMPVDFLADVDRSIPKSQIKNKHLYALVVGDENYSDYGTGAEQDVDVEYAINDATIFSKYLINTLGVDERHINSGGRFPVKDVTGKLLEQGLAWLSDMAKADPDACLLFYYAGHGSPDPVTHEAYLVPVDVTGNNIQDGIKLDDLYASLATNNPQKAIVLLDACFSGGGRNQGLLADNRSIRVKPKNNVIRGNEVVIASSSGIEMSAPYHEKQHGLFTYFLLKKLQETRGNVTLGELADFIKKEVTRESYLKDEPQTPTIKHTVQIADEWRNWQLK